MNLFKFLSKRCRKRHEGAFALVELMLVICIIGALALVMLPQNAMADSQGFPTTFFSSGATGANGITNIPATVATATLTNTLNSFIPLKQGRGASLQWQFNTSSGTSNSVMQLAFSTDGTNIDSQVIPWTCTAAGTTTQTRTTNWARGSLDGYVALVIVGFTNQNAGTLTNKGVVVNIPNN